MAKYVIAGKADCPFFAKAEMLADELEMVLLNFKVHKITVAPEDWQEWLQKTCEERGWTHCYSPLVWRELVDRGGKGLYVGGCDDFMEMADAYYGIRSSRMSKELCQVAEENLATKRTVDEEKAEAAKAINPLRVTITGGSSPVNYAVLSSLFSGEIFGNEQEISVTLVDEPEKQEALKGIVMEVEDCAWALLRNISQTSTPHEAFKNSDFILILDGTFTAKNTETSDTSAVNAEMFKQYAEIIHSEAKKSAKILVCGENANIHAGVISAFAPSISNQNICALSRLQENIAKAAIARRLNVNSSAISDLIVWGCPGNKDYIDISMSRVQGYDGAIWAPHIKTFSRSVVEMVHDDKWVSGEFLEEIKEHKTSLEQKQKLFPSMSTAGAILDLIQDWWNSSRDHITSLGVISEGWYGVPEGIVFSFPIRFTNGSWEVVSDLELGEDVMLRIRAIGDKLKTQVDQILKTLSH